MYRHAFILPTAASRMMLRNAWNQRSVKPCFSLEYTRSIANTTRPCLKQKYRQLKKKKSNIEWSQPSEAKSWRQAKIQALSEELAKNSSSDEDTTGGDSKPIPLSRQVRPCPYIHKDNRIPWKVFESKSRQLHEELESSILKLQPGELEWLTVNLTRIDDGHLSSTEIFRAIEASLPMIKNSTDRAILKDLAGWHGKTSVSQFQAMVGEKLCSVSPESSPILEKALRIPPEHVEAKVERRLDAKLHAMGSAYKTHLYNTIQDLMTRVQWHWHSKSKGDSMLPTLWNPSRLITTPLHPTRDTNILSQVKVDDIVLFLVFYKSGVTKCLGKRVAGLPGDCVKTIEGKTVQVPDGCFWALGDNPEKSFDSRHFGAVPGLNLKANISHAFTLYPPRFRCFL